jgi:hypothetical protein
MLSRQHGEAHGTRVRQVIERPASGGHGAVACASEMQQGKQSVRLAAAEWCAQLHDTVATSACQRSENVAQ